LMALTQAAIQLTPTAHGLPGWPNWATGSGSFRLPTYMSVQSAAPALKSPQRRRAPANGRAGSPEPRGRR
jgi:hypothetical protein